MNEGKSAAKTLIDSLKSTCTTKQALRQELGEAINVLMQKCHAMDQQLNTAPREFATQNQADYEAYVNGLPDVGDPELV